MIEVIQYNHEHFETWDSFLINSNNGTIFHNLRFLNYHPTGSFEWHHLMFYKAGKLVALLPAGISSDSAGRLFLTSPCGASVGGFVLPVHQHIQTTNELVQCIKHYVTEKGLAGIEMRISPNIYATYPNDNISFCLAKHEFRLTHRWLCHCIPLPENADEILKNLPNKRRQGYVNAALRQGLTVCLAEKSYLKKFYMMLEANRAKFNARPTHTLSELESICDLTPENVEIFVCKYNDKMLAGTLVFLLNNRVAYSFYPCHDRNFEQYRAATLLSVKVAEHYAMRKFKYVDLGPTTGDNYESDDGLARFKEEVGGVGFCRDTWRWENSHSGHAVI